ncbi:hypothetical protein B296_00047971 [Ensete ventricosum]|uniref:Uncharacterized protein n=1 Tax=Ensete ventricosum TaxID=4639 RepID=A0A426WXV8_ENSVE|nr:hypothetical protein B296_00047971 [Ensete ventricosum]
MHHNLPPRHRETRYALALIHPHCAAVVVALHRRRCCTPSAWAAAPAGAAYARRRRPYRRQPCPRAAAAPARGFGRGRPPPLQGALAAVGCPLVAGLAVAGHPLSLSYIPVFQIRMEKMKEVKRSLLQSDLATRAQRDRGE